MAFENEAAAVDEAITALKKEAPRLAAVLKSEQIAAATGLEYYGITKSTLERFIVEEPLAPQLKEKLAVAVAAVVRIFTS